MKTLKSLLPAYLPKAEQQTVFGETYRGVPNPNIPFKHAYPTRYHGPIYDYPVFNHTYRRQDYMAPFHKQPQGIGDLTTSSTTGSSAFDALLGAGVGYIAAKTESERIVWAGAGALATAFAGTLGLICIVGAAIYVRK
jgi:hypothetical protein